MHQSPSRCRTDRSAAGGPRRDAAPAHQSVRTCRPPGCGWRVQRWLGLRQVISARPPKPPLYTPTTVENWAATLAVTTALTAGVNAYHTVLCDEAPPEQEDGGSPASMLAAEMSTTSLNGRAEMTVALAKASFDTETSWVQTGTASNTPSLNVSWVT